MFPLFYPLLNNYFTHKLTNEFNAFGLVNDQVALIVEHFAVISEDFNEDFTALFQTE